MTEAGTTSKYFKLFQKLTHENRLRFSLGYSVTAAHLSQQLPRLRIGNLTSGMLSVRNFRLFRVLRSWGSMEFLEKLIARGDAAPPLKAGPLSGLAVHARSDKWVALCVGDMISQDASLATDLLMRALRSADSIVDKIEAEEAARVFFDGASRDALLYETLLFCLHGLSTRLGRMVPFYGLDVIGHCSDLAFMSATELARQHLGNFDVARHRFERAKSYLPLAGNVKDLAGCLIDILLLGRGSVVIENRNASTWETNVEVEVSLRSTVRTVAVTVFRGESKQLVKHYKKFDHLRFERERSSRGELPLQ